MKRVDTIISGMFKRGSLSRSARLGEIWASWERIAGPDIAAHARPIKVVGRRLYVDVDGSPEHHRLSFVKEDLLNRVRAFTGGTHIEEIVFRSRPRTGAAKTVP